MACDNAVRVQACGAFPEAARPPGSAMRRAIRLLGRAAGAVSLLLALQATALPQLLAQAFADDDADCCNPCDDSTPGQPCPPLCPNCACGHPAQLVMPVHGPTLSFVPVAPTPVRPWCASRLPENPDPAGIFHPPRA